MMFFEDKVMGMLLALILIMFCVFGFTFYLFLTKLKERSNRQ